MKKFLTGMLALLIGASTLSMAQAPAAAKPAKKTEQTAPKAAKDTSGSKLKKDGTPDKRYKENKATATEGPKKKDGTPDKRYKANKDAATPKQ